MNNQLIKVSIAFMAIILLGTAIWGLVDLIVSKSYQKQTMYLPQTIKLLEKELFTDGWRLVGNKVEGDLTVNSYYKNTDIMTVKVANHYAVNITILMTATDRLAHDWIRTLETGGFDPIYTEEDFHVFQNSPWEVYVEDGDKVVTVNIFCRED